MDETQYVCINCIGDEVVNAWIEELSSISTCSYCGEKVLAVDLDELACWVDTVYRENFKLSDYYCDGRGDSSESIINVMLRTDNYSIGEDISNYLSNSQHKAISEGDDPMYEAGQNYVRREVYGVEYHELWREFCKSIKHESRFFSLSAKNFLDNIFDSIEVHLTYLDEKLIESNRLSNVFRARRAKSKEELEQILEDPEQELYAPPASATPNGRMNANGISIFYGALDYETCLAELRLAVGEVAVVAAFSSGPLKVFDSSKLDQLSNNLSFFASDYLTRSSQIEFLRQFQQVISRPVMPGSESLEYLPTQALTEYLAAFKGIDAILFNSSQTSGKNVAVLVSKTKVESHIDFVKYEERHRPLSLVEDSVCVYKIQSVRYESEKMTSHQDLFLVGDDSITY